jgi:hypothetical protein
LVTSQKEKWNHDLKREKKGEERDQEPKFIFCGTKNFFIRGNFWKMEEAKKIFLDHFGDVRFAQMFTLTMQIKS